MSPVLGPRENAIVLELAVNFRWQRTTQGRRHYCRQRPEHNPRKGGITAASPGTGETGRQKCRRSLGHARTRLCWNSRSIFVGSEQPKEGGITAASVRNITQGKAALLPPRPERARPGDRNVAGPWATRERDCAGTRGQFSLAANNPRKAALLPPASGT